MTDGNGYDALMARYLELRTECKKIDERAKKEIGVRKREMASIEATMTEAAQTAGLESIPTRLGTAYWSTHYNCTIAAPADFWNFVQEQQAWHLIDKRANKTGVREFVDAHGQPPPGVNFSGYRVFNVREVKNDD